MGHLEHKWTFVLLQGGIATVNDLTGMIYLASFLTLWGLLLCTAAGMKEPFMTKLIGRNTTNRTKQVQTYTTYVDDQPDVHWGKAAHNRFFLPWFLRKFIVTFVLLLGGADTVNALTGMIYLASLWIPWDVLMCAAVCGLKAPFVAPYIHMVYMAVYKGDPIDEYLGMDSGIANVPRFNFYLGMALLLFVILGATYCWGVVMLLTLETTLCALSGKDRGIVNLTRYSWPLGTALLFCVLILGEAYFLQGAMPVLTSVAVVTVILGVGRDNVNLLRFKVLGVALLHSVLLLGEAYSRFPLKLVLRVRGGMQINVEKLESWRYLAADLVRGRLQGDGEEYYLLMLLGGGLKIGFIGIMGYLGMQCLR